MTRERGVSRAKEFNALTNKMYERARFLVSHLGQESPEGSKGFELTLNFPASKADELAEKASWTKVPYLEQCLAFSDGLALGVRESVKGNRVVIALKVNMGAQAECDLPIHVFGVVIEKPRLFGRQNFDYFESLEGYEGSDEHRMLHTHQANTWQGDRMDELTAFNALLDYVYVPIPSRLGQQYPAID